MHTMNIRSAQRKPGTEKPGKIAAQLLLSAVLALTLAAATALQAQDEPAAGTTPAATSASQQPGPAPAAKQEESMSNHYSGSHRVGAAFRVSTLGLGFEVATELTAHTNVRGGLNIFNYSRGYTNNGINYQGQLKWLSVEGHFDYYPFGTSRHFGNSFHLSPGLIAYNDNRVNATASVAGGSSFTLNSVQYTSDPSNPIAGNANLSFNAVAPTFMVGFGNLVPRHNKHFSFNVEAGIAFSGSPKVALALTGSACDPNGANCQNVATTPSIQTNIAGEQTKVSNDLTPFKYYPLAAISIGYRF